MWVQQEGPPHLGLPRQVPLNNLYSYVLILTLRQKNSKHSSLDAHSMATKNTSAPISFADKLYQSFKANKKTALTLHELSSAFKHRYGRYLDRNELRQSPFLRFKRISQNNEWMIYLILELDDCCNETQACATIKCPLVHSFKPSDKFTIIYPFTPPSKKQIKLRLPEICLKDRLCSVLDESTSNPKQVTMQRILRRHNELYPTFKSHQPSPEGIYIRFKSTFFIHYDDAIGDKVISYSNTLNLIPDQLNKKYLSIALSSAWMDNALVRDLVRHISQNTGKHVHDAYISDTLNLGYFVLRSKAIAQKFVANAKKGKLKCRGRIVHAIMTQLPQMHHEYQIKMRNLNAMIQNKDFEEWIFTHSNTQSKKHLVSKITLVRPKRQNKCTQCIMVFNKNVDTQYIITKLKNIPFRGVKLVIKHWTHPHDNTQQTVTPAPVVPVRKATKPPIKNTNNKVNISTMIHSSAGNTTSSSSSCAYSISEKHMDQEDEGKANDTQSSSSTSSSSSCYYSDSNDKSSAIKAVDRTQWMNMLNGINSDTFHSLLSETVNLILLCRTKEDVDDLLGCLLQFAVSNAGKMKQYIDLVQHLLAYCHQLNSALMNTDVFVQTVQERMSALFVKYRENKQYDSQRFVSVVCVVAELYVVDQRICSMSFVCNRILNVMLSTQLTQCDVEAIFQMFDICGACMDNEDKLTVNRYLESITSHVHYLGDDALIRKVQNIQNIRNNGWVDLNNNDVLQQRYRELETQYRELMAVHKELEREHNALQMEYEKVANNNCDYLLWNTKDVVHWMVHLNESRYAQYYEALISNMEAEGIDGQCLLNIDKNDLHRFGITHFQHKHEIHKHIQELIENHNITHANGNGKRSKPCVLCAKQPQLFACIPCGHLCLCEKCKTFIKSKCPVCHLECSSIMRICFT
eukprot:353303_1